MDGPEESRCRWACQPVNPPVSYYVLYPEKKGHAAVPCTRTVSDSLVLALVPALELRRAGGRAGGRGRNARRLPSPPRLREGRLCWWSWESKELAPLAAGAGGGGGI
jgi:hypothetical protein